MSDDRIIVGEKPTEASWQYYNDAEDIFTCISSTLDRCGWYLADVWGSGKSEPVKFPAELRMFYVLNQNFTDSFFPEPRPTAKFFPHQSSFRGDTCENVYLPTLLQYRLNLRRWAEGWDGALSRTVPNIQGKVIPNDGSSYRKTARPETGADMGDE